MAESSFEFTCNYCKELVKVNMYEVRIIHHEASSCSCEYCGWDAWNEWKAQCPKCGAENSNL